MNKGPNYEEMVNDILCHCIFALGSGAKMPIKLDALKALRDHVRPSFSAHVSGPEKGPMKGKPGMPRWNESSQFLLSCCETIGALAAINAVTRGSSIIDLDDLKKAYNVVSEPYHRHEPFLCAWCPVWIVGTLGHPPDHH
jgi:hypothetical protein